jgi:hypothetical protein
VLGALLRPGNAAANNIEDHISVLDAAIGRLPADVAAGHRRGDDPASARRPVVLRADSAGCSTRIAEACRDRNVGFSLVARGNAEIESAIAKVPVTDDRWLPAVKQTPNASAGRSGPPPDASVAQRDAQPSASPPNNPTTPKTNS